MTQTESDGSILGVWSENPVATVVAVGLGVALGAAAVAALYALAAGDEPPIRVRNGSISIEVMHNNRNWKEVGTGGMKWKVSRGERLQDPYQLYLAPTNPADCGNVVGPRGNKVRFVMSDGEWVEFESRNRKTELTSSKLLTRSADKKFLSYGGDGLYIKTIEVDGSGVCTFGAKDTKLHTVLTE